MTKDVKMPHEGHAEHLCYLRNLGMLAEQPEEYTKLVNNAKSTSISCGRAAASEKNLCAPKALDAFD